jgi:hypothetical protein
MGIVSKKDGTTTFKFREYEAIRGQDDIELPNNYKGSVVGNRIEGDILKVNAKFSVGKLFFYFHIEQYEDFCGIRSPKEGFKELFSTVSFCHLSSSLHISSKYPRIQSVNITCQKTTPWKDQACRINKYILDCYSHLTRKLASIQKVNTW